MIILSSIIQCSMIYNKMLSLNTVIKIDKKMRRQKDKDKYKYMTILETYDPWHIDYNSDNEELRQLRVTLN